MGRFCKTVASVVVLLSSCGAGLAAQDTREVTVTQRYGTSVRATVDGFPILVLRGTHRERGKAHGFLGAREIVKTVDAMAATIKTVGQQREKSVSWADAVTLVDRFRFPERFVAEIEGMLEGIEAALPEGADRTLSATGKPVTLDDLRVLQCGDVLELMLCSQFAAWGSLTADGQAVIGRNWDYPPFFPHDTYCIFAVDPDEEGLAATLDALWFGMIGAGFACINEHGIYFSGDDGGREEKGVIAAPCPAALAMRMAAEAATLEDPLAAAREAIDQKTALNILYHVVAPPLKAGGAPRAWIFEHMPGAKGTFEEHIRRPTAEISDALFVTNTPMIGRADADSGCRRYETLLKALSAGKGAKLDFESARSLMDSVAVAEPSLTTQYTCVAFPQRMEIHIAVSPAHGQSATRQRYTPVKWADVWGTK
jgi:hypothetical protein